MRNLIFIAVTILITIHLLSCNSEKSPAGPAYSYDIEDSKANGVFFFEAVCNKSIFNLGSLYKCHIEQAWVENSWNKQVMVFGKPKVLKFDSTYQLVCVLKIDSLLSQKKTNQYYFIGHQPLDYLVHHRCKNNQIDTIKVPLYRQQDSEYFNKKNKAFDTLTFVKK